MQLEVLYFDMDGVLADFGRGVRELCDFDPIPKKGISNEEHDELLFGHIRRVPHFYGKLYPIDDTLELFNDLKKVHGDKIQVLTGVPKPKWGIDTAADDKKEWGKRFLGDTNVITSLRSEKKLYSGNRNRILIDDMAKNIREWEEAGGTGVLFTDADSARKKLSELGLL